MAALAGLVWLGAWPARAAEPARLVLEVATADAEAVRAAVERELDELQPPPTGRLTIREAAAEGVAVVFVVFDAGDGRRLERFLEVNAKPDVRLEEIALLVANVVRDDAASIQLPPPPPVAPPPVVVAPSAAPPTACPRAALRTVGVDVLPRVGTSSSASGRAATRRLSLNVLGGLAAGLEGLELGGGVNVLGRYACGVQLAGAGNVVTGNVHGAQIAGAANVATGTVTGVQLAGLVNVAGRVRGLQLGVVNVARSSDVSIGLFSYLQEGRTHVDAWVAAESGIAAVALKHGGAYWHSLYGVGGKLTIGEAGGADFVGVLGYGVHGTPHRRLSVDVDGLYHFIHRFDDDDHLAHQFQLRALLGFRLTRAVAVFAGPSFNVMLAESDESFSRAPSFARVAAVGEDRRLDLWPGIVAGVTLFEDRFAAQKEATR